MAMPVPPTGPLAWYADAWRRAWNRFIGPRRCSALMRDGKFLCVVPKRAGRVLKMANFGASVVLLTEGGPYLLQGGRLKRVRVGAAIDVAGERIYLRAVTGKSTDHAPRRGEVIPLTPEELRGKSARLLEGPDG